MFLFCLLPLLFAQSCTIMLWKSLPGDLGEEDHSFVLNSELSAFAPKDGPKESYRAVLKLSGADADQLPGDWRSGHLVLEGTGAPKRFLRFLGHPPKGWILRSFDISLESWWEKLSRILSTEATLTLRGKIPLSAYARLLSNKEVPTWLKKDPPLPWPSGPGAALLQDPLRRFEGDTPPPGFIGKGTPYWDPIGFVDREGKRVKTQTVLQAFVQERKAGKVFLGEGFFLRGRIQMGMEPLFKEVPLTFLMVGKELTVEPLPDGDSLRWMWTQKCEVHPDREPNPPTRLPPGLDRITVSWVHHRSLKAGLFWPVTLRVLATPFTVAADLLGGIFLGALGAWADPEDDCENPAYRRHYHH